MGGDRPAKAGKETMKRWHWLLLVAAVLWGLHELTQMRKAATINALMVLGR
jgi:hypothetical protein